MSKGVWVKTLSGLRPHDTLAEEALAKLKLGDLVTAEVKKPRCLGQHRLYWTLCGLVARNMDGHYSAEMVSDVLKVRTGHVTVVKTRKGEIAIPRSISFQAMDQIEFHDFFDRAVAVVVADILPGLNSVALRAEVEAIVNGGAS